MNFRKTLYSLSVLSFFLLGSLNAGLDQFPTAKEAEFYHHHSQQQWQVAVDALSRVDLQGNESILDIGCGTGKVTANLAGRVPEGAVQGTDLSQGMIAFAQNAYTPLYNNLTFAVEDALEIGASSKYDLICSFSSLHWILDHQKLLANVRNALKPGGSIVFSMPGVPLPDVAAAFKDAVSKEPWLSYLKNYNHPRKKFAPDEYRAQLDQAGFCAIEIDNVTFTYAFETKKEFTEWFAAFSPMLFYIPKEEQDNFLKDLVETYLKAFPSGKDGQILMRENQLIIKARKN